MNREEKIEIMFESILSELEKISNSLKDSQPDEIQENHSHEINNLVEKLQEQMANLKVTPDTTDLEQKIESLKSQLGNQGGSFVTKEKHHHYFWFFPDIKGWLTLINKAKVTWFFGVVLVISLGLNYYLGKDFRSLQETQDKYEYLKFSKDPFSIPELDSMWRNDDWRNEIINFVESERAKVTSQEEKRKRLEKLRKELDSLEGNENK